ARAQKPDRIKQACRPIQSYQNQSDQTGPLSPVQRSRRLDGRYLGASRPGVNTLFHPTIMKLGKARKNKWFPPRRRGKTWMRAMPGP
ncbi:hypothetical protein, partial [Aureimonas frigidaquae]|uniref:hypothetical protein n=1 Tax=Aureimonas frigidaquae TaxID=424757 RepID=UPI001AECC41B